MNVREFQNQRLDKTSKTMTYTASGKLSDGTVVFSTVTDLSDFINSHPSSQIFVSYKDGSQGMVKKSDVNWHGVD